MFQPACGTRHDYKIVFETKITNFFLYCMKICGKSALFFNGYWSVGLTSADNLIKEAHKFFRLTIKL